MQLINVPSTGIHGEYANASKHDERGDGKSSSITSQLITRILKHNELNRNGTLNGRNADITDTSRLMTRSNQKKQIPIQTKPIQSTQIS